MMAIMKAVATNLVPTEPFSVASFSNDSIVGEAVGFPGRLVTETVALELGPVTIKRELD